mgnify:CR=1 FL=1
MKITARKITIVALVVIIIYTIPFIITHEIEDWTFFLTDYINELLMFILVAIILISIKDKYYKILIGATIIFAIDILYSLIRHGLINIELFTTNTVVSYIILPLIIIGIVFIALGIASAAKTAVKQKTLNTLFDQTNRAFYFEYNYKTQMIHIEFTDAFVDFYPSQDKILDIPLSTGLSYIHPDDRNDVSYFADRTYQTISMESYYRIKFPGMKENIWVYSKSLPSSGNVLTSVEIDFSETQHLLNMMNQKDKEIKYNELDLDFIMNHSSDFIVKYNKEGKLDYISDSFLKFFGVEENEIKGKTYNEMDEMFQIEDDTWFQEALEEQMTTDLVKSTFRGKTYYISWHNHTVYNDEGEFEFVISIGSNLTEMMKLNEKLDFDSKHDQLTKLMNRRGLYSYISEIHKQKYTLFFIDIHHFMTVNDYYCSEIGDKMIVRIAQTLQNISEDLLVVRYEGDEFILIANEDCDLSKLLTHLTKIQHKIYQHGKIQIPIHLHVGYVTKEKNESLSDMITNASLAMSHSRHVSTMKIAKFEPAMRKQLKEKLTIIEKLKQSINDDNLQIHVQGIYNQKNNKVMIESLARWFDRDIGYISPSAFFQVAKEASLIFELDFYLITKSIRTFQEIIKKYPKDNLICSINFTMETLFQEGIIKRIKDYAESHQIKPSQICVEISESTFVENVDFLLRQIKIMKDYGFLIALDDFGKEYSSLSLIKSLNVDFIKIDKVFIQDLDDKNNQAIIRMVIEIAGLQKSKVIVEGVEKQKQFDQLKALGCDYFQGYHLERPSDYLDDTQKG